MENKERELIRAVIMAEFDEIPDLAEIAVKEHGIRFHETFIDELLRLRLEEQDRRKEGKPDRPIQYQYGCLVTIARQLNWQLGVTTIDEASDVFDEVQRDVHGITREIGKRVLGL